MMCMERSKVYLCNTTLHDEKVWIVDVELDALEEILDTLLSRLVAVEEVLGYVGKRDLTSDRDLLEMFHTDWTSLAIGVVEDDSYACFGDACLTSLIDEVLLVLCTHLKSINATLTA